MFLEHALSRTFSGYLLRNLLPDLPQNPLRNVLIFSKCCSGPSSNLLTEEVAAERNVQNSLVGVARLARPLDRTPPSTGPSPCIAVGTGSFLTSHPIPEAQCYGRIELALRLTMGPWGHSVIQSEKYTASNSLSSKLKLRSVHLLQMTLLMPQLSAAREISWKLKSKLLGNCMPRSKSDGQSQICVKVTHTQIRSRFGAMRFNEL